jgi:hypothetical protein
MQLLPQRVQQSPMLSVHFMRGFDLQYALAYKLCYRRRYGVTNESPSLAVHPSGNPIRFSHSFQVKYLAT